MGDGRENVDVISASRSDAAGGVDVCYQRRSVSDVVSDAQQRLGRASSVPGGRPELVD